MNVAYMCTLYMQLQYMYTLWLTSLVCCSQNYHSCLNLERKTAKLKLLHLTKNTFIFLERDKVCLKQPSQWVYYTIDTHVLYAQV